MSYLIDIPLPPHDLALNEGDLYEKDVIVKQMNGIRTCGKLKEINGPLQRLVILPHQDTHNQNFSFNDVRYVLFSPVKALDDKLEIEAAQLLESKNIKHKLKIHIKYKDGMTAEGHVLSYTADIYGLQLFREIESIKIIRIFVPAAAIESYRIGELLGEIITQKKLLDKAALDTALDQQRNQTAGVVPRIGEILRAQGKISDEDLHKAIAKKFGLPYVELHHLNVDPVLIDLVPAELARKYGLIPISTQNNYLTVAMTDPSNVEAVHMLQFITGLQPIIVISSKENIEAALSVMYNPLHDEDENIKYIEEDKKKATEVIDIKELGQQKPIVRLTTNILTEAIRRRASDIHIRPGEKKFILLYRIDGNLVTIRNFSKALLPGIISRIKILGKMDISEHRVPQDGRTRIINEDSVVDLRISIIPTIDGESVVIRLLNTKIGIKTLDSMDFNKEDFTNIRGALNKMHGLILVTGPTGSGKSTTLYAALNEIIGRNLNIITVENPVEYHIDGIEQIQVNNTTGLTFARILKNVLRHDPDVIMIGEIRDEETAHIAIQSSLTGHLVLSTLHTNSAVGSITRLQDMNIEPYLLAPTLLCIIAQRLIKRICPHCAEIDEIPDHIVQSLKLDKDERFYYGKGCEICSNTGYSGRLAVYELLMVDQKLRNAIKRMESESVMQEIARESGMVPLADNALAHAREGRITISEVFRVSQDN
jgi:type IV pilus assembly protein PilB